MYTWIYTVKNMPAARVNPDFRVFVSKDGELMADPSTNKLIFTDWVSSLNRVAEMLKEIDKPLDPATAKIVDYSSLNTTARSLEQQRHKLQMDKSLPLKGYSTSPMKAAAIDLE